MTRRLRVYRRPADDEGVHIRADEVSAGAPRARGQVFVAKIQALIETMNNKILEPAVCSPWR